jgi:hypothetical protein
MNFMANRSTAADDPLRQAHTSQVLAGNEKFTLLSKGYYCFQFIPNPHLYLSLQTHHRITPLSASRILVYQIDHFNRIFSRRTRCFRRAETKVNPTWITLKSWTRYRRKVESKLGLMWTTIVWMFLKGNRSRRYWIFISVWFGMMTSFVND